MPYALQMALRYDCSNLRWWEWDEWAADDADITITLQYEYRAELADAREHDRQGAEHKAATTQGTSSRGRRASAPRRRR